MLEKAFKPILIRLNYNFSSTFCGFALLTEKGLKLLPWHQRPLEYDLNLSIQNSFVIYFFTVGTLLSDCTQSFLNMFSAFKPLIIDSCHPLSWSVICPLACSQKKKVISSMKTTDDLRTESDYLNHLWIIVSLIPLLWHIAILPWVSIPYGKLQGAEGRFLSSAPSIEATSSKFQKKYVLNKWLVGNTELWENIKSIYQCNYYFLCFKF